jgi:hypothetical protein
MAANPSGSLLSLAYPCAAKPNPIISRKGNSGPPGPVAV